MGNCCGGSATVPSSSPPRSSLAPTQAPSTPSPYVATSSQGISGMPAHDTTQHDHEMTTLSPKHGVERMRSQDSTSLQRRRNDRDYPPPPSASDPPYQEMPARPFKPRGRNSPQLHKSISTDTTFLQEPHSQFESGLASGTGKMPADRQERRPRFPSTLQNLLANDFRCVVRWRPVGHNNCCTIIHRFRVLVVGKVCIMYHTGRRPN